MREHPFDHRCGRRLIPRQIRRRRRDEGRGQRDHLAFPLSQEAIRLRKKRSSVIDAADNPMNPDISCRGWVAPRGSSALSPSPTGRVPT